MKQFKLLFWTVIVAVGLTSDASCNTDIINHSANVCFTPAKGTPIRKNILNALREEVKKIHQIDVIFVVEYLKIQKDWAWVHVLPKSADGTNHYEDIQALLKWQNNRWKIMELPCTEVENPECLDDPSYFQKLKKRFPDLPDGIVPK